MSEHLFAFFSSGNWISWCLGLRLAKSQDEMVDGSVSGKSTNQSVIIHVPLRAEGIVDYDDGQGKAIRCYFLGIRRG